MSPSKNIPTTIVVPVYGDWPSLSDCIDSLKKYVDLSTNKVILINDCGPDADLIERNIKKSISNTKGFHYFRNKRNLGFVKTCNRAVLELDKTKNDILLLNSDTEVTEGFLEELQRVLYLKEKITVASPRSNNATIFTFPIYSIVGEQTITKEKSFDMFTKEHTKLPEYNEVPTTHGFCMIIKRKIIEKYGLFDEAFGKGYGEEVDFCQRVKQKGYLCVASNHSYVFHLESRSFSRELKNKLIQSNDRGIIAKRYPNYHEGVHKYIKNAVAHEKSLINQPPKRILNLTYIPIKLAKKTLRLIKDIAK